MERTVTKTIAAPLETAWATLSDYPSMSSWAPKLSVKVQPAPGSEPHGVGAVRTIKGPLPVPPIVEEITRFDAPHHFGYKARSGVPLKNYSGEVTLAATPTGGTEITYTLRADQRIPLVDNALLGVIASQLVSMLSAAADKRV